MTDTLDGRFRDLYGIDPTHLSRAPGRVNLIGEHVDYAGLPVFPMALQREVRIALRPREDRIVLASTTDGAYAPCRFEVGASIEPFPDGDWGNYLKAAVQGMARRYGVERGFDALVDSTVPVAAGLSSSAALVIATALAAAAANDLSPDPLELAVLMAESEQYVGTRGGGMDQAISIGGRDGHAARVEFEPLRITPIPVPAEWRFVVAHSLVQAHKSGGAREAYNRRRSETEQALEAVVGALGLPTGDIRSYRDLLDVVDPVRALGEAPDHLSGDLLRRFRHVVSEAVRVQRAEVAMRAGSLSGFGGLMNGSHESLRTDYEVSCPELDELVGLARGAGAAGARLTGAGMGGCIVALVPAAEVDRVVSHLAGTYYDGREWKAPLDDHLFVAEPSAGASIEPI